MKNTKPIRKPVLAFVNRKGGVGKTTTVFNLGCVFQSMGLKTLLVDIDPQANLSLMCNVHYPDSSFAGVDLRDKETYGLFPVDPGFGHVLHLLRGSAQLEDVVQRIDDAHTGFDLIPSHESLAQEEITIITGLPTPDRYRLLQPVMKRARNLYDVILIDCPPDPGVLTVTALAASDAVVIPVQCEFLAVAGLRQMLDLLLNVSRVFNPDLSLLGIVLTMVGHNRMSSESLEGLRALTGGAEVVLDSIIRRTTKLPFSAFSGGNVFQMDRNGIAAHDYHALASEIVARIRR